MDNGHAQPCNGIFIEGPADDRNLPATIRNKILRGLSNINDVYISKALTAIFCNAEVIADAVKYVQRGTVYLAEIPKNLRKDFSNGNLKFMEKSTGELVGEIVGPNNFGNKGHVIIKESSILHSNIPHALTTIAMQQQLAQMASVLDDVRSRVVALQTIYDESLLGELRGMRDQLVQVQNVDDLENQCDLIKGAITQLNLTRGKITQRLIAEIAKMPNVPDRCLFSVVKCLFQKHYHDNVVAGYEKIQELFGYYLTASELLAFAYAFIGESRTYKNIFCPDNELLENEKLANLKRSEKVLGVCGERWYSSPNFYLGRIKEESRQIFLPSADSILIEVNGKQIWEAIENVGKSAEEG